MEFTYDGWVRHAFGFQNPNHAAALICLLLPWTWALMAGGGRVIVKVAGGLAALVLLVMLALTYSRTGMMVLLGSAGLFVLLYHKSRSANGAKIIPEPNPYRRKGLWPGMAGMLLVFVLAAALSGASGRLVGWLANPDKAITNRFHIWRGGVELFGVNPFGVGTGNSGLLYTAYLVPEDSDLAARTLVNSFLTVLVEQGALWGVVVLTAVVFSVWSGWRSERGGLVRMAGLSALAGGVASAFLSTCLDISVLRHGNRLGMTPMQTTLSWLLASVLVGTVAILWVEGWRGLPRPGRTLLAATALSTFMIISLYAAGRIMGDGKAPVVIQSGKDLFCARNPPFTAVMLFDDTMTLAEAARWTRKWLPEERAGQEHYILSIFSRMAQSADANNRFAFIPHFLICV